MVFVDFSKAYDRVPRGKLFYVLKLFGCGTVMLSAIIAMYTLTSAVLGSTIIASCIGVRQGSPTSCFLFIIFVEMLIRIVKNNVAQYRHVIKETKQRMVLYTANFFMAKFVDFDYVINPTIVPSWFWQILIINLTVSKSFKVINKYHENCKIYLLKIQYFFNRSGKF